MREVIKRIAREKGKSLKMVSRDLFVSLSQLSSSLNGNPTLSTLQKVAESLGVEVSDLFPKKVSGFLEYNGKIVKIRNTEDLERAIIEIKSFVI